MLTVADDLADAILFTSLPDYASTLIDKKDQLAAASAAGLSIPESWFPVNWDEVSAIKSLTAKRLIAKTRNPGANRINPFKVLSAPNGASLREKLQNFSLNPEELFIQEYIEGGDDDVFFALCYIPLHAGEAAIVTGQKLVQSGSGDGGVMVLGITTPNKMIRELSLKMIHHLNYKGFFGIEFKYSSRDKKFFFIEVNIRSEAINALGRLANIDLNIISYFDALGHDIRLHIKDRPQTGVWINGKKLMLTLYKLRKWTSFIFFMKSLTRRKEWAVFAPDDLRPFWHSLIQLIRG
jgi:predicted ATP-grasp superfamily ATP-dependent carboligase